MEEISTMVWRVFTEKEMGEAKIARNEKGFEVGNVGRRRSIDREEQKVLACILETRRSS
jgi:hypothetical protein